MIKKILSIGIMTLSLNQIVLADNSFKDMDYLVQKEMIKDTTLKLDILKKKYIFNSEEYNALHRAQQVLLDKLPVDSFSTFSRIKLHNIVDNTMNEKEREDNKKSNILTADGDLNSALIYKEKMVKEQIEREQKRKDEELSNEDIQNMIKNKKTPSPYSTNTSKKQKD